MKHFRCVIFDLDGTLTQTNELIFATFNHVAKKYTDREYTPTEIVSMFGPPEEIAIQKIVGEDRVAEAMEDFHEFYRASHHKMASAYDGIPDVLEFLRTKGVLLAVFTGKGKKSALTTLRELGILKYFDIVVTGNDVRSFKPSGDGILRILSKFQVEAEDTLMVGDAVSDIKAAREAGVRVAAVVWDSYGKKEVLKLDPDFLFDDVAAFTEWIRDVMGTNGKSVH